MRSVVSEDSQVGLLLFDEPSASLDPTAEHGEKIPAFFCTYTTDTILYRSVQATEASTRK